MKALVAVASRHGSTREIAKAIADELRAMGIATDLREAAAVDQLDGYDAVILGSAVYMGRWMSEAKAFANRHRSRLAALPVWLFSSGPLGQEETPQGADPFDLGAMQEATGAREHVVFAGSLDPQTAGFFERFIIKRVHAPYGDFRDWEKVRAWARPIGEALAGRVEAVTV